MKRLLCALALVLAIAIPVNAECSLERDSIWYLDPARFTELLKIMQDGDMMEFLTAMETDARDNKAIILPKGTPCKLIRTGNVIATIEIANKQYGGLKDSVKCK